MIKNYNLSSNFAHIIQLLGVTPSEKQKKVLANKKQFYIFLYNYNKKLSNVIFYRGQKLKNVAHKVTKWILVVKSRVCQVMKIAYCTAALCVV